MSDTYAQNMRSATRPGEAAQEAAGLAPPFDVAMAEFRAGLGLLGEDFTVEELPAPKRLAPYADAVAVTLHRDGDEIASGRLILLYDPAGRDEWAGPFRLVAYVQADVEPELAADPLL